MRDRLVSQLWSYPITVVVSGLLAVDLRRQVNLAREHQELGDADSVEVLLMGHLADGMVITYVIVPIWVISCVVECRFAHRDERLLRVGSAWGMWRTMLPRLVLRAFGLLAACVATGLAASWGLAFSLGRFGSLAIDAALQSVVLVAALIALATILWLVRCASARDLTTSLAAIVFSTLMLLILRGDTEIGAAASKLVLFDGTRSSREAAYAVGIWLIVTAFALAALRWFDRPAIPVTPGNGVWFLPLGWVAATTLLIALSGQSTGRSANDMLRWVLRGPVESDSTLLSGLGFLLLVVGFHLIQLAQVEACVFSQGEDRLLRYGSAWAAMVPVLRGFVGTAFGASATVVSMVVVACLTLGMDLRLGLDVLLHVAVVFPLSLITTSALLTAAWAFTDQILAAMGTLVALIAVLTTSDLRWMSPVWAGSFAVADSTLLTVGIGMLLMLLFSTLAFLRWRTAGATHPQQSKDLPV